ncbi:biotin transporter BioY [[Clostridium] fimetarium]|uniref:Biotin transporter n=1 Tax=[Clostridium] fimetarium TaxID=99656 RepID=A0A1I0R973_9FIRM|nr:biotin transporter BioY [[Clostridium] fimetarium]SEW37235.1 biotin transport system substrate-specific component [[Clostridium] fimetarium]
MEKKISIYKIALIGVMTAIICIIGPFSIPIGLVPISLTNLIILITVIILGWKMGTISCLIYLLIGYVGIPVFSGFRGGPDRLFGPTGGYLIGFVFLAIISGIFIDKFRGKIYMYVIGMLLGTVVLYAFGTVWFAYQQNVSFHAAAVICVIPFIPLDIVKIACAVIIGPIIRKQLVRAHILI